jgi:hypothetical protein
MNRSLESGHSQMGSTVGLVAIESTNRAPGDDQKRIYGI